MSEYIYATNGELMANIDGDISLAREEIVRCRDCKHYYEAEDYHPQGIYDRRCCKYFDTYDDEVEPNGFCKWGERK